MGTSARISKRASETRAGRMRRLSDVASFSFLDNLRVIYARPDAFFQGVAEVALVRT
jgi:hypothetical protein